MFAAPAAGPVPPVRSLAIHCADLAQRYAPDLLPEDGWDRQDSSFRLWRQARCVVAVAALTRRDLVGYAGIHPSRVLAVPAAHPLPAETAAARAACRPMLEALLAPAGAGP